MIEVPKSAMLQPSKDLLAVRMERFLAR